MKRLLLLIAMFALIGSGCRAEVRLLLDVTEDGSGTLVTEVGIDQQLRDLIDQFAGDSDAIISGLDLGLEGTSDTRVDDDMTLYTTEVSFTGVESIPEVAAGNFTSFTLQLTDEGASLEATLDVAGELDLSQFPLDANTIDAEALEARILVSLPGDPTKHNADEVLDDGRLAWDIPLDDELHMFVDTLFPSSSFPWWLLGLLALSGVLALLVWLAAVRRDKASTAPRRPAPEPPPVEAPEVEDPKPLFFDLDE